MMFVIALLAVQGCSEDLASSAAPTAAPDFTVQLFDGREFRLSEQQGKAVVINFFASWCVSCGEETPILENAFRHYPSEKVVFLGIAVDDTESKAKEFMRKYGLTIPAGLDRTGEIKDAFGLYGMPTTFFIDKGGMVSHMHAGAVTEKLLAHEIDKLL